MLRRKKLILGLVIIILGVLLLANFFRQQYVAPILMYHYVTPFFHKGDPLAVSPLTFERQMQFLKNHHYNVVRLGELGNLIRGRKKIPPKTVVLTFDDGYKNNYTYAFPVLKKYDLPATVFLIVDEIARPQDDRLNWEEIKDMGDSGLIEFGSHAIGPGLLTDIASEEELRRQISGSRIILEERLGRKVTAFSYPEGRFNDKIRRMVIDAGYLSAVATSPGRDYPDDDLFALKRLRVSERSANLFIFGVQVSGFYTFMKEYKKK